MPRGRSINRKPKEPDAVYKSRVITKMINMIMKGGKRSIAERLVYSSIKNLNEDPKEARKFFEDAVKNVMPEMEVRSRRVGGANYQIPVPVKHDRSETLALRWIIDSARAQKGSDFVTILTRELKNALGGEGAAVKKKEDAHKMANANKAFSHFRW